MTLNEYFFQISCQQIPVFTAFVFDAFFQLQNSHCKSESRISSKYGIWQVNHFIVHIAMHKQYNLIFMK